MTIVTGPNGLIGGLSREEGEDQRKSDKNWSSA